METHTIINIGRQFGSGGRSIAAELSRILGIPVYDNELIVKAAQQSGISPDHFKKSDEHKRVLKLFGIFGSNRYGTFTNNVLSDSELFRIQSEVIRDVASRGSAIFVGRASNYVLRDLDCLDVFVWAPLEDRIRRVGEREGMDEEAAREYILKKDKAREAYYNFFTFGAWGEASTYDLCINSSAAGISQTAELIVDFGRKSGKIK